MLSGGCYTAMGGGVPRVRDGQVIGGVGVSGGTNEQDIAIVEAALRWWFLRGQNWTTCPGPIRRY
jgi:uncharacterized protein GlcG (DUF336 family)